MKISMLMENTTEIPGFLQEHGLSLYIETKGHHILFDTGQTEGFAKNARLMGIDLQQADIMILSHGHYDHSGGMMHFLKCNSDAPIYLRASALEPHFSPAGKEIGANPAIGLCGRLHFIKDKFSFEDGMRLITLDEENGDDKISAHGFSALCGGKKVPDDFRHEQYLEIRENGKNILFSGCSHKGIWNIVHQFQPDVLIGGFHFKDLPLNTTGKKILDAEAERLMKENTVYYTCHCTGLEQYRYLKAIMGDRLHYLSAGQTVEIG